ncbi:MAG: NAD-dependent epimerase [Bosea sp. (in: a-proteobacteria)]
MRILVTGAAGFVGFHLVRALLRLGHEVVGVDSLNDYYDPRLKLARLQEISGTPGFSFQRVELADGAAVRALFETGRFERVVHLAAQAGVRYSISNPDVYATSNLVAFGHMLEGCRHNGIEHLVYASSSSVYGANTRVPFRESDTVDHPVSLYAATKKANELAAHAYSHLYGLPTTGLRFFTAYGPWGRPDMAYWLFTRRILAGEPIEVFNNGRHARDLTNIADSVDGITRVLERPAKAHPAWTGDAPDSGRSDARWRIYNIGRGQPVPLMEIIRSIEQACGKSAKLLMLPKQPGDVDQTFADISRLREETGFQPRVSLEEGMTEFVSWFRRHHGV